MYVLNVTLGLSKGEFLLPLGTDNKVFLFYSTRYNRPKQVKLATLLGLLYIVLFASLNKEYYVVLASQRASQELSFICVIVLNPLLKSTSRFLLQTAWFCLVIYLFVWQDKEICCSYWNPTQSRMWNDLWPFTGHIHSELGVTWWPIWGSTVLEQLLYYYYFVLSIRKGCQV